MPKSNPLNYILEVTLYPHVGIKHDQLEVTRTFSVPASTTFFQFHQGVFVAFEREQHRDWQFGIYDLDFYEPDQPARTLLRISDFKYGEDLIGAPEVYSRDITWADLFVLNDLRDKVMMYTWDMSCNLQHLVTLKGVAEATPQMFCIEGKGKPATVHNRGPFVFLLKDLLEVNRKMVTLAKMPDSAGWEHRIRVI